MKQRAVVLLSGGLDSATVLAIAHAEGFACYALTIDYGQRHRAELAAARRVATALDAVEHRVANLDMTWIGGSALTDTNIAVPVAPGAGVARGVGVPITYVPARNTVFLSLAMAWAEKLDATTLFIGANAVDYSGYPDCRPEFIAAFAALANLATSSGADGASWQVRAPLMTMHKAQIIQTGMALGVDYAATISCYQPDEHDRSCGVCDACAIRIQGFVAAGVPDPTHYRA